ncbi:hypothetical protein V8E53_010974 [Lactarius tabidus]
MREYRKRERRTRLSATHQHHTNQFSLNPATDTGRIGIDLSQICHAPFELRQARYTFCPKKTSTVQVCDSRLSMSVIDALLAFVHQQKAALGPSPAVVGSETGVLETQIHSNWQLCVYEHSPDTEHMPILARKSRAHHVSITAIPDLAMVNVKLKFLAPPISKDRRGGARRRQGCDHPGKKTGEEESFECKVIEKKTAMSCKSAWATECRSREISWSALGLQLNRPFGSWVHMKRCGKLRPFEDNKDRRLWFFWLSTQESDFQSSPVGRSATCLRMKGSALGRSGLPPTSGTRLLPLVSRGAQLVPHSVSDSAVERETPPRQCASFGGGRASSTSDLSQIQDAENDPLTRTAALCTLVVTFTARPARPSHIPERLGPRASGCLPRLVRARLHRRDNVLRLESTAASGETHAELGPGIGITCQVVLSLLYFVLFILTFGNYGEVRRKARVVKRMADVTVKFETRHDRDDVCARAPPDGEAATSGRSRVGVSVGEKAHAQTGNGQRFLLVARDMNYSWPYTRDMWTNGHLAIMSLASRW